MSINGVSTANNPFLYYSEVGIDGNIHESISEVMCPFKCKQILGLLDIVLTCVLDHDNYSMNTPACLFTIIYTIPHYPAISSSPCILFVCTNWSLVIQPCVF